MAFNPNENEPEAWIDYHERSTLNQQYEVCLSYLDDRKLFEEFFEWRSEKGEHEYLVDVKEFVEGHKGFDAWLVNCGWAVGPDTVEEARGER